MNRIVFVTSSPTREPGFQTKTLAIKGADGLFFRKQALTNESKDHILALQGTYDKLSGRTGEKALFAKPTNVSPAGGYVDFKHVKGISFEKILLDAALQNNPAGQLEVIARYEEVLKKLIAGGGPHDHSRFEKIFGPDLYENFKDSRCVHPGLLDCNFDNLIDNKGSVTVIDYEWCFDFCLPYDYLLGRALMWFSLRHAEILKMNSKKLNLVAVSDELLFDEQVYKKYANTIKQIPTILDIEWAYLQKWINGGDYNNDISPYRKPKKYSEKYMFALDSLEQHGKEVSRLNKQINRSEEEAARTAMELGLIKASRSYKLLKKAGKLKNNLLNK